MAGEGIQNVYDDTALLADVAAVQTTVDAIEVDVHAIEAITDAEAILEETGGTITTDGTEQNVYINNAPAGVYEPRRLIIDFANQTVTETVRILVYYRIAPGGPWVIDDRETIVGVPVNAGIAIDLKPTRYGVRVTIEKTAGTNRAYDWEVFYEV